MGHQDGELSTQLHDFWTGERRLQHDIPTDIEVMLRYDPLLKRSLIAHRTDGAQPRLPVEEG
eukprot:3164736-Rhodomonas_salina.1